MKTRTAKYKRYRERIAKMKDSAFPKRKEGVHKQTHADLAQIENTATPSGVIALPLESTRKKKKVTPYTAYAKRRRIWLWLKLASLLGVVIGFVCLYYFWVLRG